MRLHPISCAAALLTTLLSSCYSVDWQEPPAEITAEWNGSPPALVNKPLRKDDLHRTLAILLGYQVEARSLRMPFLDLIPEQDDQGPQGSYDLNDCGHLHRQAANGF